MVKVSGYLEKRRAGYEAVRDVPPSLREAVGRKRLRKGLGTRDVHVARARLLKALVELDAQIQAATRRHPQTDPIAAEAMAYRDQTLAIRAGDLSGWGLPKDVFVHRGELVEVAPADTAAGLLSEAVGERAAEIERVEGPERAGAFADVALGRATPLSLHVPDWLAEPGQKGAFRGRTLDDYRRIVGHFGVWLSKEEKTATVERVTRRVAGRYLGALNADGLSAARVRTIVSALAGYWTWLERRGVLPEGAANPWARQAPAKGKGGARQEPERAFTDAEMAALLAGTVDPTLCDLMRLAALSGLRIEEACRLTVGMCGGGVFQAPGTKTDAARREVPIHSALASMVARRCLKQPEDAYLFPELGAPSRYGDRSPAISKRFNRYRETVGVHEKEEGRRRSRVNFHSFRRYFVTKALQAGQPVRVVQQVVGHRLPGMTEGVYFAGDTIEAKKACVEAVGLPTAD